MYIFKIKIYKTFKIYKLYYIMKHFNLDTVKNFFQVEAKAYVTKYFVPLTDGNYAMLKMVSM